ncbi:glutamate 5-kinase [Streptomyces sp. NPDC097619]|uniref:glutamate 5-kinase n=1 Tax=Streptomyces sp. NPDC097619 TaxID=3157228 RepID=UPI00331FD95A
MHPERIVIKTGTSSLITAGRIDPAKAEALADSVAELARAGLRPVLVASGAIAQGRSLLAADGAAAGPEDGAGRRLAAAVGQGALFESFRAGLARRGLTAAQFLFTPLDLCDPAHRDGLGSALDRALERGIVPVVNENDALQVRNNDILAALLAVLLDARLLALLTDVPGLYGSDPRTDPGARLVPEAAGMTVELERLAGVSAGGPGTGGMVSKLGAVWIAALSGVTAAIAAAAEPQVLERILAGERVGTLVRPRERTGRGPGLEALWRSFSEPPRATLYCSPAAERAVAAGLAVPADLVLGATGSFAAGDVADLVSGPVSGTGGTGPVIARGRTLLGAADLGDSRPRPAGTPTVLHPTAYVSLLEAP